VFVHLGRGLCRHDGIVHGGLLVTLLDEALGRNVRVFLFLGIVMILTRCMDGNLKAITNFPEKVGVTATLSLKYKAPTRADQVCSGALHCLLVFLPTIPHANPHPQFVVMKTHLVSVDGRKARVAGRVETLDGTLLVEAE
jgi:hypothetical protein